MIKQFLKKRKMNIKKLLNAFKNLDQIKEGVLNTIFTKKEVEIIADERLKICLKCEHFDNQGSNCLAPGTQPCCSECGCSLAFKTRSLSSSCPKEKWSAWLTEEQEEKLNL